MRNLAILAVMLFGMNATAQWKTIDVNDNPFEDPYKVAIAYSNSSNSDYLKLEESDGKIYLFLGTGFVCDDYISVDLSFKIDGEWVRQSLSSCMVVKSKIVVFSMDLDADTELLDNLLKCTEVAARTNESHCDSDTFVFSGIGFSNALKEMKE